jgi:hypothetical protein
MDTFSSDAITSQTGMTHANLGGLPRNIEMPIEFPPKQKFNSNHKKKIKAISKTIAKLVEVLNKVA